MWAFKRLEESMEHDFEIKDLIIFGDFAPIMINSELLTCSSGDLVAGDWDGSMASQYGKNAQLDPFLIRALSHARGVGAFGGRGQGMPAMMKQLAKEYQSRNNIDLVALFPTLETVAYVCTEYPEGARANVYIARLYNDYRYMFDLVPDFEMQYTGTIRRWFEVDVDCLNAGLLRRFEHVKTHIPREIYDIIVGMALEQTYQHDIAPSGSCNMTRTYEVVVKCTTESM